MSLDQVGHYMLHVQPQTAHYSRHQLRTNSTTIFHCPGLDDVEGALYDRVYSFRPAQAMNDLPAVILQSVE